MENKNAIYNDDVERIVNDPERQEVIANFHHNRKMQKQRKMLIDAVTFGGIGLLLGLLGCFGWLVLWIALPGLVICGMYASFCLGKWQQAAKRGGKR